MLSIFMLMASCHTQMAILSNPSVIIEYEKEPNPKNLQLLIKEYETLITKLPKDKIPLPGIYAEYGFLLFRDGKAEQALKMFQLEKDYYPESKVYIDALIPFMRK